MYEQQHQQDRPTYGDYVDVRVFWEGVLFPYVQSIQINHSANQSTCQLMVPSSHKLQTENLVGSMLHIFYANKRVAEKHSDPGHSGPSDWPILFQGELQSASYQGGVQSEHQQLRFTSHSRHFKQSKLLFYDPQKGVSTTAGTNIQQLKAFMGATEMNVNTNASGLQERSRIWYNLNDATEAINNEGLRNLGFQTTILNIVRNARKEIPLLDYYDRKLKLSKRMCSYVDPDIKAAIKQDALKELIEKRGKSLGDNASVMDVLNVGARICKYNWTHINQPSYRSTDELQDVLSPDRNRNENAEEYIEMAHEATDKFEDQIQKVFDSIRNFDLIPDGPDIEGEITPARVITSISNWVLKAVDNTSEAIKKFSQQSVVSRLEESGMRINALQLQDVGYSESYVRSRNDILLEYDNFSGEPQDNILHKETFVRKVGNKIYDEIENIGVNEQVAKLKALERTANQYGIPEEISGYKQPEQEDDKTLEQLEKMENALRSGDQLNEFTVTPNMEFSQPPVCNVFLPPSFERYGINHNYLKEPTRLLAKISLMPPSQKGDTPKEWYLAPYSQAFYRVKHSQIDEFSPQLAEFNENYKPHFRLQSDQDEETEG